MVLICRKLYSDPVRSECFADKELEKKTNPAGTTTACMWVKSRQNFKKILTAPRQAKWKNRPGAALRRGGYL
jgi:hypothetical protein